MERTITQVATYKGWKLYREEWNQENGWGKRVTKRSYFAVKDERFFVGGLKQVKSFINSGIQASAIEAWVELRLAPTNSARG